MYADDAPMRGIDLCFAYGANATSGIESEGMCYGTCGREFSAAHPRCDEAWIVSMPMGAQQQSLSRQAG